MTVAEDEVTVDDVTRYSRGCATNDGVIYIIVKVLRLPSSLAVMVDTAVAAGKFGTLAAALTKAKLAMH